MSNIARYLKNPTSPFAQLDSFMRDFDSVFMPLGYHTNEKNHDMVTSPKANVYKSDTGYQIELAAPGFSRDDFGLNIENGVLSVSIDRIEDGKAEALKIRRREWSYNSFTRSFTLPETTNIDGITARYDSGILYVDVPVAAEKETRRTITID